MDDVVLNKTGIIRRCMKRVTEEYRGLPANLENYTIQDSIILNIQRACEAAIDLAMHVVAKNNLGVPQDSRSGFDLLREAKAIDPDLSERMKRMVGFRNIAVHNYQVIQFDILQAIIEKRLGDFTEFTDAVQKYTSR